MNTLLGNRPLPGNARLLQLRQASALLPLTPGHWYRIRVADSTLSLPVMDHSDDERWIAFVVPASQAPAVARLQPGIPAESEGPFGGLEPHAMGPARHRLLVADGTGLPCVLHAARLDPAAIDLALLGLDDEPPVRLCPSRYMLGGMPATAIAGVALLEAAGVASRVAHPDGIPGCVEGGIEELIAAVLAAWSASRRWDTEVWVFGTAETVAHCRKVLRAQVGRLRSATLPAP